VPTGFARPNGVVQKTIYYKRRVRAKAAGRENSWKIIEPALRRGRHFADTNIAKSCKLCRSLNLREIGYRL
jgi:hypothetical protein